MLNVARYLLAASLVHVFEGVTFRDWIRILRRERFRVSPRYWPRAGWVTAMSLVNSAVAPSVARKFGEAMEATRVEAPVFVLGHYRSGTTYLHELLSLDPRFASPNRFQTFHPNTFLATERWLAPLVEPFMLPRRVQEDEIAYLTLTGLSPYMDWVFPRSREGYDGDSTFRGAPPGEVEAWKAALTSFLKALTLKTGRPLILKSPPHTGRIRLILDAFPDARFVHIRRDPYTVFVSTVGLLKAVRPVFALQRSKTKAVDTESVLRAYAEMYDAYFEDRDRVPPGQLVEIAYEDLERDPVGQLRTVYDGLALADFDEIRPAVEAYVASNAGYRKNRHPRIDDETRERIVRDWSRCFDAWGYPR